MNNTNANILKGMIQWQGIK